MQKAIEHTKVNNSPACVELLICERSNGKSLRQLGWMFGRSHERIRQLLAKYDPSQESLLLPEAKVAAKLGYPAGWLVQLRKEGITNPIKRGHWLYSEEQVGQVLSLIAETRKCERCGKLRPPRYRRFCRECSRYREEHWYKCLNPEEKAEHIKRCMAWRKAHPERWKEIQTRAHRKYEAKAQSTPKETKIQWKQSILSLTVDRSKR